MMMINQKLEETKVLIKVKELAQQKVEHQQVQLKKNEFLFMCLYFKKKKNYV